jgi:hypothetical protein
LLDLKLIALRSADDANLPHNETVFAFRTCVLDFRDGSVDDPFGWKNDRAVCHQWAHKLELNVVANFGAAGVKRRHQGQAESLAALHVHGCGIGILGWRRDR